MNTGGDCPPEPERKPVANMLRAFDFLRLFSLSVLRKRLTFEMGYAILYAEGYLNEG